MLAPPSHGDSASLAGLSDRFATVKREVKTVLSLSRENHDLEAHAAMTTIGAHFDVLDAILRQLTRDSERESDAAVGTISSVQLASIALSTLLAIAAIGTAVALGTWASRIVAAREDESLRHARELEMRNRDLDSFAARVAHDLRGPLSTIGLAGARLAAVAPDEAASANILKRGVARMEALIADLLALSRIAAEASAGTCDPSEVAMQVRDDLDPAAREASVQVRFDVQACAVRCSSVLFRQLLSNLVENAIKYRRADAPPEVSVAGAVERGEYVLTVADNGLGMESDVAERIFEPFYRAPSVSNLMGTGLGLSIVKRIVDASGGAISVTSTPGRGTTFTVRLAQVKRGNDSAESRSG
jgi:signal transduction histidine kinase